MALAALITACDDPDSNVPTNPSQPTLTTISVNGPASVGPGQSAQFATLMRFADGTTKTVTNSGNLRWQSSNTSVLQVSASGLATATQQMGEATVTASWTTPARFSSQEVVVVPDGTFRVVGQVSEVDVPGAVIPGARVETVPGGIVATTDGGGQYRLYGVPPDATIRVTATGYQPSERSLQLTGHSIQNIQLTLSGPRLTLSDRYILSLDFIGTCTGTRQLPADLLNRTYEAVVTQTGSVVDVFLTEPRFRVNNLNQGNRLTGRATATSVSFVLQSFYDYYGYYYYPSIAERLPNGNFFVPSGTVTTTTFATGMSGQFNAFLSQWDSRFPSGSILNSCFGPTRFTLTRR
jgi:hypothetical protein